MASSIDPAAAPVPAGDIARRAFDAVADAERADSLEALHEVTQRAFAGLGVSIVLGVHTRPGPAGVEVELLFGDVAHPWCDHYRRNNWHTRCPVTAAAGSRPKVWSEIKARIARPEQHVIFEEMAAFSLHEGHIVAIERAGDGVLAVSLAGSEFDPRDPSIRTAAHLLSLHYGLAGFRMLQTDSSGPEPVGGLLTARQIECLKWVRDGKTAWEIGSILSISARTVEEHLTKACQTLNVRTRVQAVVEASRMRILEF